MNLYLNINRFDLLLIIISSVKVLFLYITNCEEVSILKLKYCGNCGTETEEGSNFCYQCGSKIDEINPQISSFTTANTNIPDFYKDNTIHVQSPDQGYSNTQYSKIRSQKKSTGKLIIVLILNYL